MNYHITVNGVPHCQAPIYQLSKAAGLTAKQMCECSCACGYGSRLEEADRDAAKLAAALPDAKVYVVEGQCREDSWWSTPEGRAAIESENWLEENR
jgi:hypothetical protein